MNEFELGKIKFLNGKKFITNNIVNIIVCINLKIIAVSGELGSNVTISSKVVKFKYGLEATYVLFIIDVCKLFISHKSK